MRSLTILVMILVLVSIASAKPKAPPPPVKAYEISSLGGEATSFDPWVGLKLSRPTTQVFTLSVVPPVKTRLVKSTGLLVWVFDDFRQEIKPDTTYTVIYSSAQTFIFNGKKVKTASWQFRTWDEDNLRALFEQALEPKFILHPIDIYLPCRLENEGFNGTLAINNHDDKEIYNVKIEIPMNAGINGPPIEDQLKEYYTNVNKAKNAALRWIKDRGQEPSELQIKWDYEKY